MTIDQLTTLLIKSRLSTQTEAENLATVFRDECERWNTPDTVELFCDFLASTDRVTPWQCEKLRMGKWKGFYVDDYVILEHLGKDYFSYYKARNTKDGALVRLAVARTSEPPYLAYRVDAYPEVS